MIKPLKWEKPVRLMSKKDIEMIHESSLRILDNVGIVMPLEEYRFSQLQEYGVRVSRNDSRLYFPLQAVEEALKRAPSSYVLCARRKDYDLPIDGRHGYLSTDGSATQMVDLESGTVRNTTKNDLKIITQIADRLPQISFLWPSVSAQDCDPAVQPLHELQAVVAGTEKHIQVMTAVDELNAKGSVEIASTIAGGRDLLRKRPIISNFQCSVSPLSYDGNSLAAALVFAEAGVPTGFLTMQIGCSTAPATLAGMLAMGNAEILAGIALLELCYPGTPTFYGACPTMMELKKGGITCGGPEDLLLQNLSAQMAKYYNLPASIGTFCTSSKQSDWQAGTENSFSGMLNLFSGADMMSGAGLVNGAKVFSIEQMILDCEAYDILYNVSQGIEVNEETLAYEVINRVGPQNHFLSEDHTVKNLKNIWMSDIFNRDSFADWETGKRFDPRKQAKKRAKELIAASCSSEQRGLDNEIDEIIKDFARSVN